jgi:hypothetical protein
MYVFGSFTYLPVILFKSLASLYVAISPIHCVPNGSVNFMYFYDDFNVWDFDVKANIFPKNMFNNDSAAVFVSVMAAQICGQTHITSHLFFDFN